MKIIINILLIFFAIPFANGKTIYVGNKQPYTSIQKAINEAQNYDTIIVTKGIYKEGNITINKPLTLIGNNYPILDGQKKYEVVSVKADKVTIDGFKIQHSGFATLDDPGGIKVYNSQNVIIQNNILDKSKK